MTDLERLGELASREQDAAADAVADLERARGRFLETPTPRRRPSAAVWLVAAALAATLALLVGLHFGRSPTPLAFSVGDKGQPGVVDAWLAAPAERPLALKFSDGSTVRLEPSSRARVTRLDEAGATLRLEGGRADVTVTKRRGAAWQVSLGPFRIDVTGTAFAVEWDPAGERLGLTMREGSVLVSGCVLGSGRAFLAGDTVNVSCREGRVELTAHSGAGAEPRAPAPAALASAAAEAPADSTPSRKLPAPEAKPGPAEPPSRGAKAAAAPDWRELARTGQHAAALEAAEARGFSEECNRASPADLSALGDSARYLGRIERATEAYTAVRRRFPGEERAALAAFALGRLAADQRGDHAGAARWFRTYLSERPDGRLARDALGRLLESLQRGGDPAGAQREARRYLERYPSGPHAEMARRILGT